jgi:uncharacterized protein YbjT (DUF2867 family)
MNNFEMPVSGEGTNLKVIITGATGMVGEGVLLHCLEDPSIGHVLMVNRRPFNLRHPKLTECIIPDFMNLDGFEGGLTGYDACFYCAGITSWRMSEADYTRVIYDITIHFAEKLASLNPSMTYIYVTGAMTDSSEKGRLMWARVKGRTENALMRLPFRKVYNFRPGFMKASAGQKNLKISYKLVGWTYPAFRLLLPNQVSTLRDVGQAMINCVRRGYSKPVLEIRDINLLARA